MISRGVCSNTATVQLAADYFHHNDEDVMQALVTAGAFVAIADGRVEGSGGVRHIARQRFVAETSQQRHR